MWGVAPAPQGLGLNPERTQPGAVQGLRPPGCGLTLEATSTEWTRAPTCLLSWGPRHTGTCGRGAVTAVTGAPASLSWEPHPLAGLCLRPSSPALPHLALEGRQPSGSSVLRPEGTRNASADPQQVPSGH